MIWRPFDLYFVDLIENFGFHTKQFRLEMQVTANKEALHFYSAWEARMALEEQRVQEVVISATEKAICKFP
jgi:hypothetical protein